jgi:4'-phosphopantetheinyl transferase
MTISATTANPVVLWPEAPQGLRLRDREVHIFCSSLEVPSAQSTRLQEVLSEDERTRANRFHFEKDRRRFAVSRAVLREILGQLLGLPGRSLVFSCGPHGKPYLAEPNMSGLHFNVAHSGSLAVFAMALHQEVGVDVEQLRRIDGADTFVDRFFSRRERSDWNGVKEEHRLEAFFNYWTRKEACLKATGQGLSESLDQIEVTLVPGSPARVLSETGPLRQTHHWWLQSLVPAPGYIGAVAALRATDLRIHRWFWPGDQAAAMF